MTQPQAVPGVIEGCMACKLAGVFESDALVEVTRHSVAKVQEDVTGPLCWAAVMARQLPGIWAVSKVQMMSA